jgi:hypothetical protein
LAIAGIVALTMPLFEKELTSGRDDRAPCFSGILSPTDNVLTVTRA